MEVPETNKADAMSIKDGTALYVHMLDANDKTSSGFVCKTSVGQEAAHPARYWQFITSDVFESIVSHELFWLIPKHTVCDRWPLCERWDVTTVSTSVMKVDRHVWDEQQKDLATGWTLFSVSDEIAARIERAV